MNISIFNTNRPALANRLRHGFTLVELLLVISIMAVLATMSLGVMRSATEDAKAAATRSRITQIEAMLQIELENYEVRRLPVSVGYLKQQFSGSDALVRIRNLKRRIIADMMQAEMPSPTLSGSNHVANTELGDFPSAALGTWLDANAANVKAALDARKPAGVKYWAKFAGDNEFNNPGEYLYGILSRMDRDGQSGVEALGNAAIKDSDNDGFLEVVDAWGKPMQLRILQVEANGSGEVWADEPVNWNNKDQATLLPQGYVHIDPTIPRSIDQIRFQVLSPSLGAGQ